VALRADADYLAGHFARAEHIAFAIGARRIAPPGRLPAGAAIQARLPEGRMTRQRTAIRVLRGTARRARPGPGGPVDGPLR
jgi:hypothetical protein